MPDSSSSKPAGSIGLPRNYSAYLDLVRFCAAMTVVICHFTFPQFTGGAVPYQGELAGDAVAVFFVLSGYVIAYVANEKETTLRSYAVSRLARVYSVAIPALALTIALDLIGRRMGSPLPLPMYQYSQLWKYLPIFLTFTSEIGPLRENVLTNGVFWSLSYEVWYYVTFAVTFYLAGWKRWVLLPLVLVVLGPRALIYLPIWLSGGGIYYLHRSTQIAQRPALAVFILSIAAIVSIHAFGFDSAIDGVIHDHGGAALRNSANFGSHYMLAALVCANFYAARYCKLRLFDGVFMRSAATYLAGFTFAIYLAHRPLMNFLIFVLHTNTHSKASVAILFVSVMVCVWLFGFASERRKGWWRKVFSAIMPKASSKAVLESVLRVGVESRDIAGLRGQETEHVRFGSRVHREPVGAAVIERGRKVCDVSRTNG